MARLPDHKPATPDAEGVEERRSRDAVVAATVACFAMIAQQVASKAVRDALFLTSFDVTALPAMMGLAALLSLGGVLVLARLLARHGPSRVVPILFAVAGVGFAIAAAVHVASPKAAAIIVYLELALFGGAGISGFWSLVSERFDPRSARRVFSRIGAGGAFGGIVGGLLSWRAASFFPVEALLPGIAASHAAAVVCLLRLRVPADTHASRASDPAGDASGEASSGGPSVLRIFRGAAYLQSLALLVGLSAATSALLDYTFSATAVATHEKGAPLLAFFALFQMGVAVISFLAQALLGRLSLERLGLAGTIATLPASVLLTVGSALVAPGLHTIVILRGAEVVQRNSLYRSAYELFYTPLVPAKKRATKLLIDVGADRLGTIAGSGVALLVALALTDPRPAMLAVIGALAVGTLALAPRLHRGYVASLAESLRTGAVALVPEEVTDRTTLRTLSESRGGLRRDQVLEGIESLRRERRESEAPRSPRRGVAERPSDPAPDAGGSGAGEARAREAFGGDAELDAIQVALTISLLDHYRLRGPAREALSSRAPRATGQLVDALLDARQSLAIRRGVALALATSADPRALRGLLTAIEQAPAALRPTCVAALVTLSERHPDVRIPEHEAVAIALRELGADADARHTSQRLDRVLTILSLALDREPLRVALHAVVHGDARLRGTAVEYLDNVLPAALRGPVLALVDAPRTCEKVRPEAQLRSELLQSMSATSVRAGALAAAADACPTDELPR